MTAMSYKEYLGSAEVSVEDGILHGRLLGIRDLVTYEADTPAALRSAFVEAVDEYLADCTEQGRRPDRPYKGSLNVRIGPELHRSFALEAMQRHLTLNELIVQRLHVTRELQHSLRSLALTMSQPARVGPAEMAKEIERMTKLLDLRGDEAKPHPPPSRRSRPGRRATS